MKPEGIAANGVAVLVSFLLLIIPPSASSQETSVAALLGLEKLETGTHSFRASLQLNNRVEHLLLNAHEELNQLNIVDSTGKPQPQTAVAYRGIVESMPLSRAEIVIDGDFIAGTINTGNETLQVASTSAVSKSRPLINFATSIDQTLYAPPSPNRKQALADNRLAIEIERPFPTPFNDGEGQVTRVARIGLVIDSQYNEAIAGRGVSKAIATINSVDGMYREQFGLALKVDVVVLLTDEETLLLNGETLEDNLLLFKEYRSASELLPFDLALVHFFTGIDAEDNQVGLAYTGTVCQTNGFDVSLSRPFLYPEKLTAHEIGHNLGAEHDDIIGSNCDNISDHLMFSQISNVTTREFSSCSTDSINTRLEQSTCFVAAIDLALDMVQLESNQILATVTNQDEARAFPAASLRLDLKNAAISEAPANCELADPDALVCAIPATFPGDTHEVAVKLRLTPDEERVITATLTPAGFFDLQEANNSVEMIIPGDPQPLASTEGEITTPASGTSGGNAGGVVRTGGGGALTGNGLLWLLVIGSAMLARRRSSASY